MTEEIWKEMLAFMERGWEFGIRKSDLGFEIRATVMNYNKIEWGSYQIHPTLHFCWERTKYQIAHAVAEGKLSKRMRL